MKFYGALLVVVVACIGLGSCGKDKDGSPAEGSRNLRYEISGSYSGTLFAAYTGAEGNTTNEEISLPWVKELTYAGNVTAANIGVAGNGGLAGQTVTIVIKRGNVVVSTTSAITGSSGGMAQAAPVVIF
ncbi:MAG: hypothetical protein EOO09_10240 [Chitinophagaceae bacterium]|nr:MAG: hypothetical protein EOO09_10240 [Chitinophagaceae bacterium]